MREAGEPATQGGPKLTGQTGSLRYMAPEVALCEPYDERADVYSFAIILWQMAARAVPFAGVAAVGGIEGFIERVARQGLRPPLPPKWPAALRQTLATCWEAEVPRRATICAALPALESLLASSSSSERPGPRRPALLGLRRGWPPCSAAAPPSRAIAPVVCEQFATYSEPTALIYPQ